MTTQPPPESAEPASAYVEALAAKVHESWMAAKFTAGVTSCKLETGEELMVPYDQLSEQAKGLDRATVRAVLAAQAALAEPAPVATDDGGGCWCSDRMSAGIPCLPHKCPNRPAPVATDTQAREDDDGRS